jgi:hypothetical protein
LIFPAINGEAGRRDEDSRDAGSNLCEALFFMTIDGFSLAPFLGLPASFFWPILSNTRATRTHRMRDRPAWDAYAKPQPVHGCEPEPATAKHRQPIIALWYI